MQYRWRHKNGGYRWASGSIFPIYESAGDEQINKVSTMQVVVRDITERKDAEEQIRTSLAEKEVLLKEIHHRVKNNLQIISSLLHLQSTRVDDESLSRAFENSQHRIRAMALIHEELYTSGDLGHVDFVGYVRRLVDHLFDSFGVSPQRISCAIEVDSVPLTIDRAIPFGLIINELVSNSLKYAFPDRGGGILVEFVFSQSDAFHLTVSDDGVGFPEELDYERPQSLGLQLVSSLAGQLDAELERLPAKVGTVFRVHASGGE